MSLIEEALRKTQQQTAGSAPAPAAPPAQKPAVPMPSLPGAGTARGRLERAFVIGGMLLIAGIVGWEAWAYLSTGKTSGRSALAVGRAASRASGAQVVQTSLSQAMHKPLLQPTLRLSGVVEGPGEPLAIINGAIVRVGEQVAGATVLEIGNDYARMRWRDEDIVLRTGD